MQSAPGWVTSARSSGARMSPSAPGAPCARTTAPAEPRGRTFPHDQARSRAYRWSEDGLGAICDTRQRLCLGFAFWNGQDPILKERIFGLTGNEGNHGEDAKEYWWYLDSTPSHSWMRWRYHYPRREFPYDDLVSENRRRGRLDPEYELLDTGALEDYWQITIDYAKAADDDVCIRVAVRNSGPDEATLHVLPTLWFRNSWSWTGSTDKPSLRVEDGAISASHAELDPMVLCSSPGAELLFCDNESNARRLWDVDGAPYPKDAINDHVVNGLADRQSRPGRHEGRVSSHADRGRRRDRRVAGALRSHGP